MEVFVCTKYNTYDEGFSVERVFKDGLEARQWFDNTDDSHGIWAMEVEE